MGGVSFDETKGTGILVEFVSATNGQTGVSADVMEIQESGVALSWVISGTKNVWFVPWSNVKAIHQDWAV